MDQSVSVSKEMIIRGLRRLGVGAGDILLVHSSISRFGYVEGGVDTVIDALLESVDPGGTVMVPTLTGSEHLSADDPPIFDPLNSACWTGKIPETFRNRPEALRSLHPTHSVAIIGPHAKSLARDHEICPTPCGVESPYGRLVEMGGKVVLLGVSHQNSTLFHHIEEIAQLDYHIQKRPATATILLPSGETKKVTIGLHQYGTSRDFNRMESVFKRKGVQHTGKIGNATIRVVSARGMVACTMETLKQNPNILFER
jgi:aminoglycoside 3-N-acetyltransferase